MIKSPEVWFNQEGQLKGVEFKIVQPLADLMSTEINDENLLIQHKGGMSTVRE